MTRIREWLLGVAPPVAVAALLWAGLASPDRAFSVPVNQGPSVLEHLTQVKTVLVEGEQSPRLPWIAPIDLLILRAAGRVVPAERRHAASRLVRAEHVPGDERLTQAHVQPDREPGARPRRNRR